MSHSMAPAISSARTSSITPSSSSTLPTHPPLTSPPPTSVKSAPTAPKSLRSSTTATQASTFHPFLLPPTRASLPALRCPVIRAAPSCLRSHRPLRLPRTCHAPTSSASRRWRPVQICLLYTSDAADDLLCVDLGG